NGREAGGKKACDAGGKEACDVGGKEGCEAGGKEACERDGGAQTCQGISNKIREFVDPVRDVEEHYGEGDIDDVFQAPHVVDWDTVLGIYEILDNPRKKWRPFLESGKLPAYRADGRGRGWARDPRPPLSGVAS